MRRLQHDPAVFIDKLQRYGKMKLDHTRKRAIFLRKPMVIALNPSRWLQRRRPRAAETLPPEAAALRSELAINGFVWAEPLVDPEKVAALQVLVDERIDGVRNAHTSQLSCRKDFWQMIMTTDDLREGSPLVEHAMTPAVLDLVTAYLGEVPYLSRIELVVSRPTDGSWKVSQLWHRDFNDSHMVKLFTYLSDVDAEAQGPFTFLPADAAQSTSLMFQCTNPTP